MVAILASTNTLLLAGASGRQLLATFKPSVLASMHARRAYFSVQYCTLCAVLMAKCAVLNVKMCSIEI